MLPCDCGVGVATGEGVGGAGDRMEPTVCGEGAGDRVVYDAGLCTAGCGDGVVG